MVGRLSPEASAGENDYRRQLIEDLTYEIVPMSTAEAAVAALPPTSTVSVTCSPVKGIDATMELSDRVVGLGHTAIPHLAARLVEGPGHVERLSSWLRTEGHRQAFVIGGDTETPTGPYHDATGFLRDLLDTDHGLRQVGVAAYPDGHALIDASTVQDALFAKQRLLAEAGVEGYASTQMCFDPARIDTWLQAQRHYGLTLPVHLGVPGVVDRAKLMSMGVRLGIGASLRYLKKNSRALGRLLSSSNYDPNRLLEPLSPILETAGVSAIHCFTFNQVEATVAWQRRALEQP